MTSLRPLPLLFLLLVAACAPRIAPPGPGLLGDTQPGFTDEAFITADGLQLPYRRWLPLEAPPQAVLLALHGFNDYSHAFEAPAADWAARGIATYAYDQRGFGAAPHHGLWPGEDALVADLGTAAAALKTRYPKTPLYLLGSSMGGAVILAALTRGADLPVAGVVLAAPAVWARRAMPWYQRAALFVAVHTVPWASASGEGTGIQASDNIEMLRGLGRDPLFIKETRMDAVYGLVNLMDGALEAAPNVGLPALLLYGEKDELIPAVPTLELWRNLPQSTRRQHRPALYANGWHLLLRDLEAEVVRRDVASWLLDPAAPLPSGADDRARRALEADGVDFQGLEREEVADDAGTS